jgi:CRISPR-associated endonuclease/helicase Cas3
VSDIDQFWAKSNGESVARHTLRVLTNLQQLRARTSRLAELCQQPGFWPLMALTICLHDLGKCAAGFQRMLREPKKLPFRHRHEVVSVVFLRWIMGDSAAAGWAGAAIATHHRDWADIDRLYPAPSTMYDLEDGLEPLRPQMTGTFFAGACRVLREGIWPRFVAEWDVEDGWSDAIATDWAPTDPVMELRQALNLVRATIDDLQQRRLPDPKLLTGTFLRGAIILADHSGSAHEELRTLKELGNPERARIALGIKDASSLYNHQRDVSTRCGHAVLTAPTGSGKTEAAILWTAEQAHDSGTFPLVYYLLPYQASLNAMYARLNDKFHNAATLQHSRAIQAIYRQLLAKEYTGIEAQRAAKRERNLAELYAKPLRISTPYQLLKGAFQLKGHEALWTAAACGLFVFDEIHAYEPGRLAIMLETLRYLCGNLGARALIMSATLPSCLRTLLGDALADVADIRADRATFEMFRRHEVRLISADLSDNGVIDRIVADYRAGMAVLVVATTVGRAQEVRRRIAARTQYAPELLHGRFHSDDRTKKEQEILLKRGRDADRSQGLILVATQVVEVSLNVDFDTLYSDPAPLEALLQRFGRVNRFRTVPTRVVHVCRGIPDGCPVYSEPLVTAAVTTLEKVDGSAIDEAGVQSMLDEIYDGRRAVRLQREITTAVQRFRTEVLETCRPFASDEGIERMFDEQFEGYEVLPSRFEAEYTRRVNEEPLLAPGLLVLITRGQYWKLRRDGRLRPGEGILIADCRYETDGLEIDAPAREDGV